ncbi:NAD(P)/FAD-dependent oxidoreductase [Kitasatospora sp. NPDC048540]|uniref:dihydrolipoyl dehydrogenase family protein n=1 Tax=Kitasatospora sp. NPDC048540 TaxID=3155634 RepID=UPI0033C83C18
MSAQAGSAVARADEYDVVVLGGGPAGENLADRTAAAGLRTVLVESELVGGECSYWACMPSKALLRPGSALAHARAVAGVPDPGPLDAAAVLTRRDDAADEWKDDDQVAWLRSAGIELVRGHGRLAGERAVRVGDRLLTARHAVAVCTGTRAALPEVPGLADARPWTSRDATSAERVPGRLAVIGGGVVAVEMATAWNSLGAHVTLLVRGDGLLGRMEPFAGELVADGLRAAGVDVRTGTEVTGVRRVDGAAELRLGDGGSLTADEVLYAVGRTPGTGDLGLETVGLEPGGWLAVDDGCLVRGVPGGWLYAAGDVNRRALMTHQGKYQARICGAAIVARARGERTDTGRWGAHTATADTAGPPQVVFTEPEAAAVGLTAAEAARRGMDVRTVDHDLGAVAGASLYADGYTGRARMVVDRARGVVVGMTFVGPAVAELLHSATIAVVGEVPLERLWHAVPSFPTVSEVWLRLLEGYRDQG